MWLDLTKASFHTLNSKADFWPSLNFYINELTIHMCIIAKGFLVCFYWGLFLWLVWHAWVLGWSSNGSGVTGQVPTWLEIITWLVRKLGHQLGYYLISRAQMGPGETIWQCSTSTHEKTCYFVAPYHPWPPLLCNHLWYWCKNGRQFS